MKYYIVDDEIGIVKTLENIIESRGLGEVIGYETDPESAVEEILLTNPEIVLVDLLMSKMDGITLVERVKAVRPQVSFIMLSKVTDKGMVEQAYNAGVEFFIHKPVNIIEVEKVLNNVSARLKTDSIVNNIKGLFASEEAPKRKTEEADELYEISIFLGQLGMMGEKGTADILSVCRFLIAHGGEYNREVLGRAAEEKGDTPKNIEQRMRRAIKKGLKNVANLALDDYGSEVVQVYAGYVFDFKNVKDEMEFVRGRSLSGGRVSIPKFIEGLLLYRRSLKQ